jgi:hypothetical protein
MDPELDRLAAHMRRTWTEPFFLTIHHEPEEEVREIPGSGYRADDYAAMFRHVVERLRAQGVVNAVRVFDVMGTAKYVPARVVRPPVTGRRRGRLGGLGPLQLGQLRRPGP